VPYWALITFLILTFFTGGASRADVQSLIILRPAAVIFCGIGLWSLKWEHVKAYRHLFSMAAAIFALVLSHLIPLPPSIWGALPGREIITEIDKVAQLGEVWRPISMVPSATWNAFYSLFVPLAVLILGAQLSREERLKVMTVTIGIGMASAVLGLVQVIGPGDGPLYFYEVTNNWSAVGLFANRNHQALFLDMMFPMLAIYASTRILYFERAQWKGIVVIGCMILLVPLVLVTGSRAGLIIGGIFLVVSTILYRTAAIEKRPKGKMHPAKWSYLIAAMSTTVLGATTYCASRAEAVDRLFGQSWHNELRFKFWEPVWAQVGKYFPVGSGVGSFEDTYKINEPYKLLDQYYLNHSHNEFLEIALTGGIPAIAILWIALFWYLKRSIQTPWKGMSPSPKEGMMRLGIVLLPMYGLSSVVDYPLRVPSLEALFVLALVWATGADEPKAPGLTRLAVI
jgi:O-antigen ligase